MEIIDYIFGVFVLLVGLFILRTSKNTKKLAHFVVIIIGSILLMFKTDLMYIFPVFIMFMIVEYISSTDYVLERYVSKRTENYLKSIRVILLLILSVIILVLYQYPIEKITTYSYSNKNEYLIIIMVMFCLIDTLKRRRKWKY
jgi:hypothetical protein